MSFPAYVPPTIPEFVTTDATDCTCGDYDCFFCDLPRDRQDYEDMQAYEMKYHAYEYDS